MGLKSVKQELFMNEMFLLKLGEMVLKGANRRSFEDRLKSNLRRRLAGFGNAPGGIIPGKAGEICAVGIRSFRIETGEVSRMERD